MFAVHVHELAHKWTEIIKNQRLTQDLLTACDKQERSPVTMNLNYCKLLIIISIDIFGCDYNVWYELIQTCHQVCDGEITILDLPFVFFISFLTIQKFFKKCLNDTNKPNDQYVGLKQDIDLSDY